MQGVNVFILCISCSDNHIKTKLTAKRWLMEQTLQLFNLTSVHNVTLSNVLPQLSVIHLPTFLYLREVMYSQLLAHIHYCYLYSLCWFLLNLLLLLNLLIHVTSYLYLGTICYTRRAYKLAHLKTYSSPPPLKHRKTG